VINIVDHRKREKIKPSDNVHLFVMLMRNKDNDILEYPTVYRRIIRNYEQDLKFLIAVAKERKGNWRIYRTVNKRSFEKANKIFRHRLIDDYEDYYYRLESLWKTCLLQKESRAEKNFLIDIDRKEILEFVMWKINYHKIEIVEGPIETPNGFHIVTKPFDRRFLEDKYIEINTDRYVFVEQIKTKIEKTSDKVKKVNLKELLENKAKSI